MSIRLSAFCILSRVGDPIALRGFVGTDAQKHAIAMAELFGALIAESAAGDGLPPCVRLGARHHAVHTRRGGAYFVAVSKAPMRATQAQTLVSRVAGE